MAASLVTEFPSLGEELSDTVDNSNICYNSMCDQLDDEAGLDRILDQEFPGLGVDFDFCSSLELGNVDLPLDIWNTPDAPVNSNSIVNEEFDLNLKPEENFSLEDEFNQMLNDWGQLGEPLNTDEVDDLLPAGCSNSNSVDSSFAYSPTSIDESVSPSVSPTTETDIVKKVIASTNTLCSIATVKQESVVEPKEIQQQVSPQTVTLKRPANFGLTTRNNGNGMLSQTKQLPLSTTLRTPVVTRGFCYTTRSGGLGMSRAVQSTGIVSSNPKVTISNQFSISSASAVRQDESNVAPPLFFAPLSPIKSSGTSSGSNAPDFFIASTRPTAEVMRSTSSNYNRLISSVHNSRNSIYGASNHDTQTTTNRYSVGNCISSSSSYQQQNSSSSRSSSPVKIIAAVSPRSDGTSCTKIFSSNSSIRDSLPKELIDKIRAASQGRKTIAIIEPINRKDPAQVSNEMIQRQKQQHQQQQQARQAAVQNLNNWKTSTSAIQHSLCNNVSDHDYCSPTGFSRFSRKYLNAQTKVMRQMEEMKNKLNANTGVVTVSNNVRVTSPQNIVDEGETKKDSGLESCEMSDASEDGTYDRLPRYLTNASVQTDSRPPTVVAAVQDDQGGYNRLPAYLFKPQQSLLKSNICKSVVEKHNIVVSHVNASSADLKLDEKQPVISLAESPTAVSTAIQVDAKITTDVHIDNENNVISRVSLGNSGLADTSSTSTTTTSSTSTLNKIPSERLSPPRQLPGHGIKRRRGSIDSSSDETDTSYRRSVKRKRLLFTRDGRIRTSSRERRRRYRGRSRSRSSSTERSSSRSDWSNSKDKERSSRRHRYYQNDKKIHSQIQKQQLQQQQQQQLLDPKSLSEERRIVYVGKIEEGTLKSDLRSRFEVFGPILDISMHFRERGENYGFLTFKNTDDAKKAIEHGNKDAGLPQYDLCFGGRRNFCREDYCDLDDVEDTPVAGQLGFDQLLKKAIETKRK